MSSCLKFFLQRKALFFERKANWGVQIYIIPRLTNN